ncbi:histidinol phosphate phosphatase, partial [Thioclava sp. BHET1]
AAVEQDLLAFAESLCDEARPIAMRYFRTGLEVEDKLDASPVTIADREIERMLRDRIAARYPEHGIRGEEFGVKDGNGLSWIIDPIDGTKSFITGYPLFGTLISLVEQDRPLLGVIDMPAIAERWTGTSGQALCNGKPVH